MTMHELQIRAVLNQYCDQHGGGGREIEITPGRFGGYYVSLVWDGFVHQGLGDRLYALGKCLIEGLGDGVFLVVRKFNPVTFSERAEQHALAGANAREPDWIPA